MGRRSEGAAVLQSYDVFVPDLVRPGASGATNWVYSELLRPV